MHCVQCSANKTSTDVVCRLWAGTVGVLFRSKEFEVRVFHVCEPNHVNVFKCLQLVTGSSTTAQVIKINVQGMVVVNCCDNVVLIFFADRVLVPLNPHP